VYDYTLMATSKRHNNITGSLFANVFELFKKNEINPFQEEVALVYEGERKKNGSFRLVDVRKVRDPEKFIDGVINDYEYVQPDFAFFMKNPYLTNRRETRTAGEPDLIVEVYSCETGCAKAQGHPASNTKCYERVWLCPKTIRKKNGNGNSTYIQLRK